MSKGTRLSKDKKCENSPVLTFSYVAWKKMWALTQGNLKGTTPYECTSFGIMDPNNPSRVVNIWVPKQQNTPGSTETDPDDILQWLAEMHEAGIDPGQISMWHHSHASMDVFWSETDLGTIRRYAGDNLQWSVVTNVKGYARIRADLFKPVRFYWDNCDWEVEYPEIPGIDEWFKAVSKEKIENSYGTTTSVKKGTYKGQTGTHGYHRYGGRGQYYQGHTAWDDWEGYDPDQKTLPDKTKEKEEAKATEEIKFESNLISECYAKNLITLDEARLVDTALKKGDLTDPEVVELLKVYIDVEEGFSFTDDDEEAKKKKEALENIIAKLEETESEDEPKKVAPKEVVDAKSD
jgi:hypothetical protein